MKVETRGRPKTFDETEALTAAMNYFWEHGYDNTSLDNLLLAMNIKKSSFYATFKSKEEVFSRCLLLYRDAMISQLKALNKEIGPKQTLLMLSTLTITELKETGKVKGCLLVNSSQECYKKYTQLSKQIALEFNFFQELFATLVKEGQEKKEILNPKNAKIISGRYMNTLNGLIVSIQAGISEEQINDIIKSLNEILE
jgi:TetR/AcrR family transcriptional repressor of nem operon